MTSRLLIECGVAQTRAACLIDDVVWKFWFGHARGDEADRGEPRAGCRYAGRVQRVDASLNAAFIDIGASRDGFLALTKRDNKTLAEGALVVVEIKSPPRQDKGATLRFVDTAPELSAPGPIGPAPDPVIEAVHAIGADASEIIVDSGEARVALNDAGIGNVIHESRPISLFETSGAERELVAALGRFALLRGGGRLVIDEAQALTSIDVDSAGLNASSSARLREKMAIAAAEEAARQISLRNVGGHVVIDFPPISSDTARARFQETLFQAMGKLDGARAMSFSKSGLFSLTLPHKVSSLLDQFTERHGSEPTPGRRFTVYNVAQTAIRALETRLRTDPSARLNLAVGKSVNDCLEMTPQWCNRLTARYGARFDIETDQTLEGRSFDISE